MLGSVDSHPRKELPGDQREQLQSELLNRLGHWMLSSTQAEPGWDQLVADIKPSRSDPGFFLIRLSEVHGDQEIPGAMGRIGPEEDVLVTLEQYREASYTYRGGAWLSATVILRAEGWPEPSYGVGAELNHDEQPEIWADEAPVNAADLEADLLRFPRDPEQMPSWMTTLLSSPSHNSPATASIPDTVESLPPQEAIVTATDQQSINEYVARALEFYAEHPSQKTVANVLRSLMGGQVLLEVSTGTPQVLLGEDGRHLMSVYIRESTAHSLSAHAPGLGAPALQSDRGIAVLQYFLDSTEYAGIVVEPNSGASCRIEREQIQWALDMPHNDAAKEALLSGDMMQVLGSFMGPGSMLLVGSRPTDPQGAPVSVTSDRPGDPEKILLFTSAPEIASVDPTLMVRAFPALAAFGLALDAGAEAVSINGMSPSAVLPAAQIRELLEIAASQQP